MRRRLIGWLALATLGMAGTTARAQQPAKGGVDPLLQCRSIADSQQRLACFDRQSEALGTAVAAGTIVVLDKQAVRSARRSLFGLDVKLPFFRGEDDDADEPRQITAKATSVKEVGHGFWIVALDNGSVWQTIEAKTKQMPPRPGDEITIRKATAGGYVLKLDYLQVRAKRTR